METGNKMGLQLGTRRAGMRFSNVRRWTRALPSLSSPFACGGSQLPAAIPYAPPLPVAPPAYGSFAAPPAASPLPSPSACAAFLSAPSFAPMLCCPPAVGSLHGASIVKRMSGRREEREGSAGATNMNPNDSNDFVRRGWMKREGGGWNNGERSIREGGKRACPFAAACGVRGSAL